MSSQPVAPIFSRAATQPARKIRKALQRRGAGLWVETICYSSKPGPLARRVALMTEIDLRPFLTLRRHLRVAHHIPGRIRLRIAPTIVKELGTVDGNVFDEVLQAIHGIRSFRANPSAGSIVVEYVPAVIQPDWWDTLIHGDEAKAVGLLQRLLENELAPAVAAARRGRDVMGD